MGTFLEICQEVGTESGIVSPGRPTSVVDQTGMEKLIVQYVQAAWTKIQNAKTDWQWMRGSYSYNLTASTAVYTPASFGLTRHRKWHRPNTTIYKTATGVTDECPLQWVSYDAWVASFDRGSHDANRPAYVAMSPARELCFGPTPDAEYTVRGFYWKNRQELTANGDIPELPEEYHDAIKYMAQMLLSEYEETGFRITTQNSMYLDVFRRICRTELPDITLPGPIGP